ncbi:hypothetical protein [Nocardioides sp. SYSU D00065]|uniref:hypothetical protein n=1 Tax=Nocardioides sp. SYSU D00065 TaxID=2817378 RepID=UPI001B318FDB|nr:hypothetical protein [Nocardioides sp. SYSU D00065]
MADMRGAAAAAVITAALVLGAGPAQAHPFGDPQTVEVSATPDGVRVDWAAAPDDVTALAAYVGVVGGSHVVVFEDGEYAEDQSSVAAGIRLAEEPEVLEAYLLEHIAVTVGGEDCAGSLEPVDNVQDTGAGLAFDCGGPVSSADVTVRMLTDIDPAYRTLATSEDGQRRVYTAADDTFTWRLGKPPSASGEPAQSGPDAAASAVRQLGAVAAGAALVALAAVVVRRRRTARSG